LNQVATTQTTDNLWDVRVLCAREIFTCVLADAKLLKESWPGTADAGLFRAADRFAEVVLKSTNVTKGKELMT
jgi:hypothetical protein